MSANTAARMHTFYQERRSTKNVGGWLIILSNARSPLMRFGLGVPPRPRSSARTARYSPVNSRGSTALTACVSTPHRRARGAAPVVGGTYAGRIAGPNRRWPVTARSTTIGYAARSAPRSGQEV